ncbi:MAG: thioredoxin domain-containing protein, partial [Caldilineaceae bacterium]
MHVSPLMAQRRQTSRLLLLIVTLTATFALLAGCNLPGMGSDSDEGAATEAAAADGTSTGEPEIVMAPTDESFNGLPVGFTDEGWPFRGNPSAPVTMYEFSDYQCPFCNRYFVQTEPAINETYVQSGQLRVVFRDLP